MVAGHGTPRLVAMASQDLAAAYAAQRQAADLWRAECEEQIALLAMCTSLDVFQLPYCAAHCTFPCPFDQNCLAGNIRSLLGGK